MPHSRLLHYLQLRAVAGAENSDGNHQHRHDLFDYRLHDDRAFNIFRLRRTGADSVQLVVLKCGHIWGSMFGVPIALVRFGNGFHLRHRSVFRLGPALFNQNRNFIFVADFYYFTYLDFTFLYILRYDFILLFVDLFYKHYLPVFIRQVALVQGEHPRSVGRSGY